MSHLGTDSDNEGAESYQYFVLFAFDFVTATVSSFTHDDDECGDDDDRMNVFFR